MAEARPWGLILAGGASRRMGRPKGLVPFGRGVALSHLVGVMAAGGCAGVAVALGAHADAYGHVLTRLAAGGHLGADLRWGLAPGWAQGMRFTLAGGLALVPMGAPVVLTHVDRPTIRPETVAALVAAADERPHPILPTWRGRSGHPVYLPPVVVAALRSPMGEPLRAVLPRWSPRALTVADPAVVANHNTPRAWCKRLRHPPFLTPAPPPA